MRKEYTYNDWLEDRQYFDPDDPILTSNVEVGLSEHMSLQQFNSGIRNSPEWLYKQEKVVSESDYQQIISAKKEAFKIILNAIILDIPKHLGKLLQNEPDKEHILKNKLVLIDKYFENNDKIKEQIDYIEGNYPPFPVSGSEYLDIIDNQNFVPYLHRSYAKNSDDVPTILPPHENKYPKGFMLSALLYEERRFAKKLISEYEFENISTKKIYQKYHKLFDGGNGMKAETAYNIVKKWLLEENELTKEEVKDKWDVSLEFYAFTRSARNNRY